MRLVGGGDARLLDLFIIIEFGLPWPYRPDAELYCAGIDMKPPGDAALVSIRAVRIIGAT